VAVVSDGDPRLEEWLASVLATPGLTGIRDGAEARRVLLDDSLAGVPLVQRFEGPVIDVGSGGGAPGIPIAAALPDRAVTLLEAAERKWSFLHKAARSFPNAHAVRGRAEEQQPDAYGVALAKALASPPVAAEWCLPLVRPGGAALLWIGPSVDRDRVGRVAELLNGELEPESAAAGFLVLRKLAATPPGFPRRPGVARKRPLG
jgi:16S rRNA (guanine527-N7)-methyltransferase